MTSQITSLTIVYSTVYSGADQRIHQSSASLAFVRWIHRWPVNSPHKGPVTRKMFPFGDVTMQFAYCCGLLHFVTGQFSYFQNHHNSLHSDTVAKSIEYISMHTFVYTSNGSITDEITTILHKFCAVLQHMCSLLPSILPIFVRKKSLALWPWSDCPASMKQPRMILINMLHRWVSVGLKHLQCVNNGDNWLLHFNEIGPAIGKQTFTGLFPLPERTLVMYNLQSSMNGFTDKSLNMYSHVNQH